MSAAMGSQRVQDHAEGGPAAAFRQALLDDLAALEQMLAADVFEVGPRRIGVEQEYFLVDAVTQRAAPRAAEILERMGLGAFTTEMGQFNLEANVEPVEFHGGCLGALEGRLTELTAQLRAAARPLGAEPLLCGILPSLGREDLSLAHLTDKPRYHELNRVVMQWRGGAYPVYVKGLDELRLVHDNVMLEAACTSFQVHLQVDPAGFAAAYNAAQCAAAPVLAAAVNSPLLLGRRLWHETRIALFQHAVDERPAAQVARQHPTRVWFGDAWVRQSAAELFAEQIARFRVLLVGAVEEDSRAVLASGGVPALAALRMHNGSVWRWNRPCYGVIGGRPHLRIEFRALPAGPSVRDEVANAAFFLGLVTALPARYGDVATAMPFEAAKENFYSAARHGLKTQLDWMDGQHHPAERLILDELLPLAAAGLRAAGVTAGERYLDVIHDRVASGRTGSQWALDAWAAWGDRAHDRGRALVAATLHNQATGEPVDRWPVPTPAERGPVEGGAQTAASLMSTDLFTVAPDDTAALAASIMTWRGVHHVPVEDDDSRLVGLVASRHLLGLVAQPAAALVRDVMDPAPVTITPDTPLERMLHLAREHRVDCLPVLSDGRLAGLVTIHDLLNAVAPPLWKESASA